jgi:hypothetical protein
MEEIKSYPQVLLDYYSQFKGKITYINDDRGQYFLKIEDIFIRDGKAIMKYILYNEVGKKWGRLNNCNITTIGTFDGFCWIWKGNGLVAIPSKIQILAEEEFEREIMLIKLEGNN